MRVPGVDADRDKKTLRSFLGLNNTADTLRGRPGRQGLAPVTWQLLQQADNVDINNEGLLSRRDGYRPFAVGGQITASFSTFDFSRFYVIDTGTLYQLTRGGDRVEMATGLAGDASWAEVNGDVFLSAGRKLVISSDGVAREWGVPTPFGGRLSSASGSLQNGLHQVCFTFFDRDGREGGASPSIPFMCTDGGVTIEDLPNRPGYITAIWLADTGGVFRNHCFVAEGVTSFVISTPANGRELTTQFLDQPPEAAHKVAVYQGRLCLAEYLQAEDITVVWFSEPLGFHLFNLNSSFIQIPGRLTHMAAVEPKGGGSLMLSTERQTFLYNQDGLQSVADYGAIPGQNADWGPDDRLYFWTSRGLCRVSPFENLTESDVSLAPGVRAAGSVFNQYGYNRFVVVLKSGGAAFNKR